ncbi:MAG: hypothetical protein QN141_03740 [Armatimonadota bacterium]|nr:hypothetical protein [Armatimonadota bacterium]MDR7451457.1 hypothetical protein [Armatimonadota bacterium]MDR7466393.1 hypothetical protein [Armatimonadota bacterium]MDR7493115.1 hypothetical protein [Armatimonadota bacterium]MDR7498128.1 hypothetical protein [Armatimonadota bacterium]
MLPEHRRALHEVKTTSMRALGSHREALRPHRGVARRVLLAERERTRRAAEEYQHRLNAAKAEAQEFRVLWAQAKKDGRRLLEFIDRHLRRRAA